MVAEMKRTGAVIGGEGNGGVIYPALALRPRRPCRHSAVPYTSCEARM
ncbi:MAG: hypothetical protein MZV63_18625 [Marinilabiliales bacterium]|nr:hypothetical protein [Marinilabiliales bacterium]